MADHRTPEEIEREIEEERAQLSSTLDSLTDKFSVDRAVRTTQGYVSEHGGELAANFARTIKETPTAAVLTAVGIAWMMIGNQRKASGGSDMRRGEVRLGDDRPSYGTASVSMRTSGSPSTTPAAAFDTALEGMDGSGLDDDFDSRVAAADARMRAQSSGTTGIVPGDRYGSGSFGGSFDADRDTVSRDYGEGRSEDEHSMLERISDHAQDLWHRTISAIGGGYRSASRSVRGGAESAYRSATELRNSLFEGTESMDVAGRERVATARARAYEAQVSAKDYARQGQQRANDFFHEQPLVAGALAVALGAVVGGMLPRTQREDDTFGAYRDQLLSDAEAVFQDERQRVEAAARAAVAEAGQIANEAKDSVLNKTPDGREVVREAEDQARTAAQRIADAAREAHDSGSTKTA